MSVAVLYLVGIFGGCAVIVLIAYLLYRQQERHDEQILKLDERYRRERQELISRIQRPTFTPTAAPVQQPERAEPDELQRIGQVMPFGKQKNDA